MIYTWLQRHMQTTLTSVFNKLFLVSLSPQSWNYVFCLSASEWRITWLIIIVRYRALSSLHDERLHHRPFIHTHEYGKHFYYRMMITLLLSLLLRMRGREWEKHTSCTCRIVVDVENWFWALQSRTGFCCFLARHSALFWMSRARNFISISFHTHSSRSQLLCACFRICTSFWHKFQLTYTATAMMMMTVDGKKTKKWKCEIKLRCRVETASQIFLLQLNPPPRHKHHVDLQ